MLVQPIIYSDYNLNEVWKPLVFEDVYGEYMISNFGNIYNIYTHKYIYGRINNNNGYVYVSLISDNYGKFKSYLLHRIVAANFIASKRPDQTQVNHIDGNKTNNHASNLEWTTPQENTRHAFDTGLAINNIGENSHFSKLTNSEVEKICKLLSEGKRYEEILYEINLPNTDNNRDMIGNIYRGIAWKDISKKYTFPEIDQRFRKIPREKIEAICKAIEDGYSNKEVYKIVFGVELENSRQDKQTYETIRLIRNKKQFKDISEKYNF